MFSKKLLAALAAFTLASGAVIGTATPAFADDGVVTDTETTTTSIEAPAIEPDATPPSVPEPVPAQPMAAETAKVGPPAMSFAAKPVEEPAVEPEDDSAKKVEFCHATASNTNPYVMVDTSVNAFYNAGHDTHQNFEDIVPPFSYVKQGQTINFPGLNWDAAGQAIFNNGCERVVVVPGVASASVSFTPASCTAAEQLVLGTATNATWGTVTDPAGSDDYSVTDTAIANAYFAGGVSTLTFRGELDPVDTSEACDNTTVKKIEFCHATGSDSNPFVLLETSVSAFFSSGHDTHQDFRDIVPPFSYLKQGVVIDFPGLNWDAEGRAFLAAGCEEPVVVIPDVATASVSFTPETCTAAEMLVLNFPVNATWGPVTDPAGSDDYSVTATAATGALFDGGLSEITFSGKLNPVDTSEACDNTSFTMVQLCHATDGESDTYELLNISVRSFFDDGHDTHDGLADVVPPFSYLTQGEVMEFAGLNWDAAGQAFFENDCEQDFPTLALVLPTVTFTQATCDATGSYTLGVAQGFMPNQVTFTVNGTPGVLAGTYAAADGSTTVTVQPVAPDGIDFDWVNPPAFVFATPSASDCSTVTTPPTTVTPAGTGPTLPRTGAGVDIAGLISLGSGLVFLGAAAMYLRRRTGIVG